MKSSILLIYTGGTIGMLENPSTSVLEPLDFAYLGKHLPELGALSCNILVETLAKPIDSSAIRPDTWVEIARIIERAYHEVDGFVVLHGTDTMAYTASALSFMLKGLSKPVIFTGSQLPVGRLRTDGRENLISAIEIALARTESGAPRVPEVCIFFQDYLLRGNRSSKVNADHFEAFKSYNYPRLALAGIDIHYNDAFIHRLDEKTHFKVHDQVSTDVAILKLFPGITQAYVEAIFNIPHLKGVVLETFGSGNAPSDAWFVETVGRAIAQGIVVVNVSQCSTGYVDMCRYETGHKLYRLGVVSGMDMTTEAALTKLMVLCGMELDTESVKRLMSEPRRGEMSLTPGDSDDLRCWERLNCIDE